MVAQHGGEHENVDCQVLEARRAFQLLQAFRVEKSSPRQDRDVVDEQRTRLVQGVDQRLDGLDLR